MPNTCEKCGEVFYSDTEYKEHLVFHKLDNFFEIATAKGKETSTIFSIIAREIRLISIHQLMRDNKISFDDAVKLHFEEWYKVVSYEKETSGDKQP